MKWFWALYTPGLWILWFLNLSHLSAARLIIAAVLLLGAGVALVLYAMRLVAAAFGCGFSPFAYLALPDDHGWQALLFVTLVAACFALLLLVLRDVRDELWLVGGDGGVLVPCDAVEQLLRETALKHAEVVRVDTMVRVRRATPAATLDVDLRPLAEGDAVAAELASAARGVAGAPRWALPRSRAPTTAGSATGSWCP